MYLTDIKSSDHLPQYVTVAPQYITVAPQLTSKVYNNLSLRETGPEVYNSQVCVC